MRSNLAVGIMAAFVVAGLFGLTTTTSVSAAKVNPTVTGTGTGTITCADGSLRQGINIEFAAVKLDKTTITSHLKLEEPGAQTNIVTNGNGGFAGKINKSTYSLESDGSFVGIAFCDVTNSSDILNTISGKCGANVAINYAATNGEKGQFIGNVQCY